MGTERPFWQKAAVAVVVLCALFWGYYNFYYKAKAKKISDLKLALLTTDREIEMIRPADILQKGKLPVHEMIEKQLAQISEKIPNELEIPYLLQGFIANSAKGLNIHYDLIQPMAPVQEQKYKRVPIKVAFTCDFDSLNSYIMNIENLPITIRTDTLDISKAPSPPMLNIKMDLSAFVSSGGPAKAGTDTLSPYKVHLTDPFFAGGIKAPSVKKRTVSASKKQPAKRAPKLPVFAGVFDAGSLKAFVDGELVGVGGSVKGYEVQSIEPKKVIVKKSGKIYTLFLGR